MTSIDLSTLIIVIIFVTGVIGSFYLMPGRMVISAVLPVLFYLWLGPDYPLMLSRGFNLLTWFIDFTFFVWLFLIFTTRRGLIMVVIFYIFYKSADPNNKRWD